MKRIYLITMLFCLFAIGAQAQTTAPASSPGQVMRIIYYDIKPGKGAEYMKYRREHAKPILDEMKTIQHHFPLVGLEEMLSWATLNGAKALKMDDMLGSLQKPLIRIASNSAIGHSAPLRGQLMDRFPRLFKDTAAWGKSQSMIMRPVELWRRCWRN